MNISRGSETARTRIDLKSWLPTFVDNYCQSGLAPTDRFQLNFESDHTTLLFDTGHLNQILTNLCTNACVHGGPDKPITIRVFLDSAFALGVEIADQGPGIDNDILEQIFEPFYTTSHQGSGLGLYIVAQLCELNNATISARKNQYNGQKVSIK